MIRTICTAAHETTVRSHHYDFEMTDSKGRKIGAQLVVREAQAAMTKIGMPYMYVVKVTRDGEGFGGSWNEAYFEDPDIAYIEALKKVRQVYKRYVTQARKAKRKAREAAQ